jgi:hypothetical protein
MISCLYRSLSFRGGEAGMTVIGISLTPEERYIRSMFEEATEAGDWSRRAVLWKDLQRARFKGVRRRNWPYVRVRLEEEPERVCGSCLVTNLRRVGWVEQAVDDQHPLWLRAEIACDLLFETDDPACMRPGRHPHALSVYIEDSSNSRTAMGKLGMRRLRRLAGPLPGTNSPPVQPT